MTARGTHGLLLARCVSVCLLCAHPPAFGQEAAPPATRPKPPFRVLFSNDTTNILTCVSPYHKKRQPFSPRMLEATVDEAAGVDVHMLQPGLGWIPWWKSKSYPAAEHRRWFRQTTGRDVGSFTRYVAEGGDIVGVFVERCRARGQIPFISLRLNDGHHLENVGTRSRMAEWVSRFYAEHPEYRIGKSKRDWNQRVHNWAIAAVRDHKFAFIRELCERYDIDGFELDFMRHTSLFRLGETPSEQRKRIVTRFVARVRKLLDRTAKPGRRRWLCARVPSLLAAHDRLGIDLRAMADAGLGLVNLSAYYFTMQQNDVGRIAALVPDAAVYVEMTHCTTTGPSRGGYDSFSFRRTTDPQFHTAAHLAYRRGAHGVSLFNFVYYREHGTPGRGPFGEPPFGVLKRLGQPQWLAKQPQWYVLAKAWNVPAVPGRRLPRAFRTGQGHTFTLDMAPTEHQRKDGLLRLMTQNDSRRCRWTAQLNGQSLAPTPFVARPLDHPHRAALGQPSQYACFRCPRALIRDGLNKLALALGEGGPATIQYIDLVLP